MVRPTNKLTLMTYSRTSFYRWSRAKTLFSPFKITKRWMVFMSKVYKKNIPTKERNHCLLECTFFLNMLRLHMLRFIAPTYLIFISFLLSCFVFLFFFSCHKLIRVVLLISFPVPVDMLQRHQPLA